MPAKGLGPSVARLAALLTCAGLATSRLGLVVHELVGHGGATLAVGGEVTQVRLFYVAGGWIRYRLPNAEGALTIALGGIVVEVAIGVALWLALARRPQTLGIRVVRAIGAALVIHATWYLATGTWHGYGDGAALHRELADARWLVAVPAAAVTCGAAFAGAKLVLGPLAGTIPGTRARRLGGTLIAVIVAGGLQLGAAVGEVALRRDPTYGATMRPERERVIERELAAWARREAAAGGAPTAQARGEMQRELARRHRTFPFAVVLGVLVAAAIALGAWRSRALTAAALTTRLLARSAAVAAAAIALVVVLDAVL